jgi:hypothetical protein
MLIYTKYFRTETENSGINPMRLNTYVPRPDVIHALKVRKVFAQEWRSP